MANGRDGERRMVQAELVQLELVQLELVLAKLSRRLTVGRPKAGGKPVGSRRKPDWKSASKLREAGELKLPNSK